VQEGVARTILIMFSCEDDHAINTISQVNASRQLCLIFSTLKQVAFIFFLGKATLK